MLTESCTLRQISFLKCASLGKLWNPWLPEVQFNHMFKWYLCLFCLVIGQLYKLVKKKNVQQIENSHIVLVFSSSINSINCYDTVKKLILSIQSSLLYLFLLSFAAYCSVLRVHLGARMTPGPLGPHLILLPLTCTLANFQEDHKQLQVKFHIYEYALCCVK